MPVQVLVAVTTHNNIVSTNFGVAGAVQGAFSLPTPLEEQPSSRFFYCPKKYVCLYSFYLTPKDPLWSNTLQLSPRGGPAYLQHCTHVWGWGCVGCAPAVRLPTPCIHVDATQEASWWRCLNPVSRLLFDMFHLLGTLSTFPICTITTH